jgi:DNA primase
MIKYNIGYCEEGEFASMVVIPSYDENGFLNYYVGRSFQKNAYKTHRLASASKDIVGMEMLINWDLPVILCEGALDAIAIKRNAIPLFGKKISQTLMKKLVTSRIKKVYLALDDDALKDAIKHAETLINYGKKVYLIEMEGKDPSELGFEEFTKLLHVAEPLSLQSLLTKKLAL